MQRLVDFGKTASSKLTVDEFNKIDLEEEADPPSFTKARQRAKQAQIYDETVKYAEPELLAQLASTQERVEEVLARRKAIEEDIANRSTILPTTEERKKMLKSRLPVLSLNLMQGSSSNTLEESNEKVSFDSSQSCFNNDIADIQSKSSLNRQGIDETERVTQKDINEKKLLETIALFNESQQDFENEDDGDDDDDDNVDNLGTDVNYGSNQRQQSDNVTKKEGELSFFNFVAVYLSVI